MSHHISQLIEAFHYGYIRMFLLKWLMLADMVTHNRVFWYGDETVFKAYLEVLVYTHCTSWASNVIYNFVKSSFNWASAEDHK